MPVPLRSHWQAESHDCWTRSGRDEGCLVASHSRLSRRDPRPRGAQVSPDQLDCPASLSLRPLRSTATHQFRHVGHWVWLAIGDGASAQVEPALGVSFGLHAFGDGLPVVDFGLIHGEQIKNLRNPSEPETVKLSVCSSACRPRDPKNPVMALSVRMTGDRWRQIRELPAFHRRPEAGIATPVPQSVALAQKAMSRTADCLMLHRCRECVHRDRRSH